MNYVLMIIAIIIVLFFAYMYIETYLLRVNSVSFSTDKDALKILHLSDIHINMMNISPKRINKVIRSENPDVIFISGDFISNRKGIPKFLRFLNRISGSCRIITCLGNHEYESYPDSLDELDAFVKQIENKGITVLQDSTELLEKNSNKYKIIGLNGQRRRDINLPLIHDSIGKDTINVILAHNPDLILQIPENAADYMFCGHFHGGQIWTPFNLEFILLRKEKLCRMGIKQGLHKIRGINMYINAGLGCVCFPLRFLSRPEISIYLI